MRDPNLSQQVRLLDGLGYLQIMIGDVDGAVASYATANLHADRWRRRAFPMPTLAPLLNIWERSPLVRFANEFQQDALVRLQFEHRATEAVLVLLAACQKEQSSVEATPEEVLARDRCRFGRDLVEQRRDPIDRDLVRAHIAGRIDELFALTAAVTPTIRQLDIETAVVRDMAWRGQVDAAQDVIHRLGGSRSTTLLTELIDALAWSGRTEDAERLAVELTDARQRDAYEAIARSYAAVGDLAGLERIARKTLANLRQPGQTIEPTELSVRSITPRLQATARDASGRALAGVPGMGLPPLPSTTAANWTEEHVAAAFFTVGDVTALQLGAAQPRSAATPHTEAERRARTEFAGRSGAIMLVRAGMTGLAVTIVERQAELLLARQDDDEPTFLALMGIVDVLLDAGARDGARVLLELIERRFSTVITDAEMALFARVPSRRGSAINVIHDGSDTPLTLLVDRLAAAYGLRHATERAHDLALDGLRFDNCRAARYAYGHSRVDHGETLRLVNPARNPRCYARLISDLVHNGEHETARAAIKSLSPGWLARNGGHLLDALANAPRQAIIEQILDLVEASCVDSQRCTAATKTWELILVAWAGQGATADRLSAVLTAARAAEYAIDRDVLFRLSERFVVLGNHEALRHLQAALSAARLDASALDSAIARALASAGRVDDALALAASLKSSTQRLQIIAWATGRTWAVANRTALLRRGIDLDPSAAH